jgi:Matrixin
MTASPLAFCTRLFLHATAWLCFLLSGCLFDSSYWQQKAAQRNVAQQRTPRALEATPAEANSAGSPASRTRSRVLRVRALATPSYAAEVIEWPRQFARLLDDANRILEPTLDVRFEVVEARTWNTSLSNDSLDPLLTELRAVDRGDDVDCVVGLIGSLPVFAHAFHQLGYGDVMGKHLALRAMNDAREREAIDVELSRLPLDDRERLYQTRKRHKATAVFLHEVGHTLGLIHELDPASIMSMRYDKSMSAFSPTSAALMRMTVERGKEEPQHRDERAFAERLLREFERTQANWVPVERDQMIASLKVRLATPDNPSQTASSGSSTAAKALDEIALKDVAPPDRDAYARAIDADQAGRPGDAWTNAEALFLRYPDVYAVQDLRCRLALKLSSGWQDARRECERLMDISHGKQGAKAK